MSEDGESYFRSTVEELPYKEMMGVPYTEERHDENKNYENNFVRDTPLACFPEARPAQSIEKN
jgi:hypothetical protein